MPNIVGTFDGIEIYQYDVVQICINNEWKDYSTIKDASDFGFAERLIRGGRFGGHPIAQYRIARRGQPVVQGN